VSAVADAIALASFKLRFFDVHVRAVPQKGLDGCPFAGPGVDIRGEEARRALEAAAPVRAWLEAREPGIVLRSLSIDHARQRVLITLEPAAEETRPRVLRFDPPHAMELALAARDVERIVGEACVRALRRRASS
jgi:hypothetical protein